MEGRRVGEGLTRGIHGLLVVREEGRREGNREGGREGERGRLPS
jgi:hypothetical protein